MKQKYTTNRMYRVAITNTQNEGTKGGGRAYTFVVHTDNCCLYRDVVVCLFRIARRHQNSDN